MAPPPVPDRTETLSPRADSAVDQDRPDLPRERPEDADDPDRYEQVCEHARGGLGRVVRAVDKRLGRTVAVKELLPRAANGSTAANEARFLREALITARLEHPGIVPVHEAGRWPSGDPYYVMKLVEGRTLKELIHASSTLRDRLALLGHVMAVADAVGYAHSQGVIHRDLKPSNVIVGEFGETIVVDWGLARDTRRDSTVPEVPEEVLIASGSGVSTVSGKVVGTPAYMSPEQARGELVDERADVYAIGAVLYELLAGSPPHHDDTPQATLERVIAGPPRPIALVAHVPGELATIVGKAMERDPSARYANASVLAEDLRRYQTGKLVSAHSYSAWSLMRKKVAQHRGVVAMAIVSMVALAVVGVESFRRVVAERNIAQTNSTLAEEARRDAEKRQRDLVLLQSATSLRKDPTASLAWLKTYELTDADRAHVLDIVDEAIALGVARHVFRPSDWVYDSAFTPDNKAVVVTVRDSSVRVYDLATGSERRLGRTESAPEVLAMSPDGSVAVTGGMLGEITVWQLDPAVASDPKVLERSDRPVKSIHFSADRTRILVHYTSGPAASIALDGSGVEMLGEKTAYRAVVASANWSHRVVATSPNQIAAVDEKGLRPLAQTQKLIERIFVSPQGDQVIIHDGVTLWAVPFAGGPLVKLVDYDAPKLNQVVWSPDGGSVAVAGDVHDVVLIDTKTQAVRSLRGHTDAIYTVQWTRDGRRILSASDDSTARVWNVADGTSQVLRGHDDDVYRARFSNDERQVVSNSLDGSVRVWVIEQPGARVLVEGTPVDDLAIDGTLLRTKTSTETARWNITSGHREPLFSWAADPNGLGLGLPSPDGEKLLVPSADWSLEVRDRSGGSRSLQGHKTVINHIEFSKDSRFVYTSSVDGTLRKWDLDTGEAKLVIAGTKPVRGFAVARDGRIAVQVGEVMQLITPRPDGEPKLETLGIGLKWCITKAEFEPVRDRLVLRRCDNGLAILDGDRLVELPTGNYEMSRMSYSADGTRIAAGMADRTVRVWDAITGRVLRVLRGHSDLALDVAFSPDGSKLASASYDKTIRVWDLASERQRVLRGHALSVSRVLWRDPVHLVSASRDGTLRLWDVPATELPSVRDLAAQLDAATSARIDIDRPTTGAPRGI